MKLLLKAPKICDVNSPWNGKKADVLIDNDRIVQVGGKMPAKVKTIDAKGMWLTPGWIDTWAFFCDPGLEYKEDLDSGRNAAMQGGFTGVAVLPNTLPVVQTKNEIKYIVEKNDSHLTALYPIAAVTHNLDGKSLTEMIDLHHHGAIAFSDGLQSIEHGETVVKVLRYLAKFDGLLIERPEDKSLTNDGHINEGVMSTQLGLGGLPNVSEEVIVQRDLDLLNYAGGRIHFTNVSTSRSLNLIARAKRAGKNVTCSVASYQTLFTDSDLISFDTNLKVNPPFRSKRDNNAIVKALEEGTIDVIASNHMPQDEESKKLEFDLADFGMTNLQTFASTLVGLSEKVDMEILLEKVSVAPRKLLRLPKATIEKGEMADLTLFDPKKRWIFSAKENLSRSKNSPWLNREIQGKAVAVIRGNHYWIDGLV